MPDPSTLYTDCFILFKYFGGRNIARIERELRSLGHTNFNRRILYSRTENGIRRPGWIAKFQWDDAFAAVPPSRGEEVGPQIDTDPNESKNNSEGSVQIGLYPRSSAANNSSPPLPSSAVRSSNFHAWLQNVSPGMSWHWRHQQYIIDQLQKVTDGECKRLMIFLPPRHGKSELVTVRYSAWRMQQDPSMNIILGSYNQRLADRFSRKIRKAITEAEARSEPPAVAGGSPRPEKPPMFSENASGSNRALKIKVPKFQLQPPATAGGSDMFPFTAIRPANSISEWETAAGGGFRSVGVGGGVTGFGAQLIVVDDPIKSRAEAESETYRERVWDWFNDDLYTRLEPGGAMILIQTRWHEDDLAGRLLREMHEGGEHWAVIDFPAIAERNADALVRNEPAGRTAVIDNQRYSNAEAASVADEGVRVPPDPLGREPGEALCPERFDIETLEKIRRKIGSYSFSALYQQRPTPSDGGTFKREWFKRYLPFAPAGLKWKRGYDLAVSTKTTACYTATFRCAFDKEGNLYIDGGFRKRIEYPEQRRLILQNLKVETDTEHGIELALHGNALIQDLRRERAVRGHLLRGVKVETDKLTRALAWAPLAEESKIILIRGRWNRDFLDEVCAFPSGQHDDQVDAVSLAVQMLKQRRYVAMGF